jgi:hypothetical protein
LSDNERHPPPIGAPEADHPLSQISQDLLANSGSTRFPALQTGVHGAEFEDPLSYEVAQWFLAMSKAAKGIRVYAQNNQMLKRYLDDAHQLLLSLFDKVPEITLTVREDKLLYGKDVIHSNNDRDEGIPFTLYRNAFRKVTFVHGMTREEMTGLLSAIVTDYHAFDYAGEDLSTELWRLALPHLRYLTIDVMAVDAKRATDQLDRQEIERIQDAIEDIVGQIYKTQASDDIVAGVTITKEDLEALKEIRQEEQEDLDLLDVATARAIVDVEPHHVELLRRILTTETRDSLSTKLIDILVIILFKEQSASESGQTIELIKLLYDSLLVSQRFEHAKHLIDRLREYQHSAEDLKVVHISGQLLRLFSTEARVMPVLNSFNDAQKQTSVQQMLDFLRMLGAPIVPILLSSLDFLTSPAHRRLICDLVLEYGVPDRQLLWEKMQNAKWFVVRDILGMAQRLPLDEIAGMVNAALKHEHPKVREHAVGLLRGYARGTADRLVAERLLDPDLDVRLAAIRVAAARRSLDAKAAIETVLGREDLADREPRELRLLMAAYAAIAGPDAVIILDRVLNPGFFARSKMTEAQIAAAFALASIGNSPAMQSIQRGLRTLNTRVRDACKKALSRDFGETSPGEISTTGVHKISTPIPNQGSNPFGTTTGSMSVLREASSEHKASGEIRTPRTPLPSIDGPSHTRIPGEGTPSANRSARAMQAVPEDAPAFVLAEKPEAPAQARIPIPQAQTVPNIPRPANPNVGRVLSSQPRRDEIPINLPPVRRDAFEPPAAPAPEPEEPTLQMISDSLDRVMLPPSLPRHPPPLPEDSRAEVMPDLPRFSIPDAVTERNASPRGPLKLPSNLPPPQRPPAPQPEHTTDPSLSLRPRPPPNAPPRPAPKPDPSKESSSPRPLPRMPTDPRGNPIDDWASSIPGQPDEDQPWAADLTLDPPRRKR